MLSIHRLAKGISSRRDNKKKSIFEPDDPIHLKITKFWQSRKKKKKQFYVQVVKIGLYVAVVALVLQYVNFAVQSIAGTPLSSPPFLVLQFFGIVIRVFGICIYSTVPCSEFDFCVEVLIKANIKFRRFVFITLGFLTVIGGIAVGKLLGNCLLYLLDVPVGLCFFYFAFSKSYESTGSSPSYDYVKFIRTTNTYRRITFMFQCDLVVLGLAPGYFSLYNYIYGGQNNIFILLEAIVYLTSALIIFTLALVGNFLRSRGTQSNTVADDRLDSFMKPFQSGANDLNIAIFICQMFTGMGYIMYGCAVYQDGGDSLEIGFNYLTGIGDFIPLGILLFIGPQRCFWMVAYWFEQDASIKLDDGAFMAELVSTCAKFDTEERVRWVYRKKPEEEESGIRPERQFPPLGLLFDRYQELEEKKASEINRIVFIKATLLTIPDIKTDKTIKLKIDFQSDMDMTWKCTYQSEKYDKSVKVTAKETSTKRCKVGDHLPVISSLISTTSIGSLYPGKVGERIGSVKEIGTGIEGEDKDDDDDDIWRRCDDDPHDDDEAILSTFNTWKTENIELEELSKDDEDVLNDVNGCNSSRQVDSPPLFLYVSEPLKDQIYTMDYLKKWASKNLRKYKFDYKHFKWETVPMQKQRRGPRFSIHTIGESTSAKEITYERCDEHNLLNKSPRALENDREKEELFLISTAVDIDCKHCGRIDFFVSHSWEDDAVDKSKALTKFATDFESKYGRRPSLWLDKVCIDQKDQTMGVAVLPINIGACNKMLILFSKSYIKRLWCVWELFTLGAFCAIEAIVFDRVEFVKLDGIEDEDIIKELQEFDLNNAHTFGPNEEFQLRSIINEFDPGGAKLKKMFNQIASMLQKRLLTTQRSCTMALSRLHVVSSSEHNVPNQANKIVATNGDIEEGH